MASACKNPLQVLCHEQVGRLDTVLLKELTILGRGNFPALTVSLKDFVPELQQRLTAAGINVKDVRLNGGAASHVLRLAEPSSEKLDSRDYSDLDLIFSVDLPQQLHDFQKVKTATLDTLIHFMPDSVNKEKMTTCAIKEAYVHKMVKVCNEHDTWSLISVGDVRDPFTDVNVELKFVSAMKRQFEFSVDSFQIILDSFLTFYKLSPGEITVTEHFYPTIVAESLYGDFTQALEHLNSRLIATRHPEQIRGGGLLKYCRLLAKNHKPVDEEVQMLQRYMCSRFFIDFGDILQQQSKLESYLNSHFSPHKYDEKAEYLKILKSVMKESTVCLMGHERQQILSLIDHMIYSLAFQEMQKARLKEAYINQCDWQNQNNLVIDQMYACSSPPTPSHSPMMLSPVSWYPVTFSPLQSPSPNGYIPWWQ